MFILPHDLKTIAPKALPLWIASIGMCSMHFSTFKRRADVMAMSKPYRNPSTWMTSGRWIVEGQSNSIAQRKHYWWDVIQPVTVIVVYGAAQSQQCSSRAIKAASPASLTCMTLSWSVIRCLTVKHISCKQWLGYYNIRAVVGSSYCCFGGKEINQYKRWWLPGNKAEV